MMAEYNGTRDFNLFTSIIVPWVLIPSILLLLTFLLSAAASSPAQADDSHWRADPVIPKQLLSLSLDEAVTHALQNNRAIKDSEYALESSVISLKTARSVFNIKIRPLSSINYTSGSEDEITVWQVGGTVSKIFHNGINLEVSPSIIYGDEKYDAGLGFGVAVPLLRGFGTEIVLDEVYAREFAYVNTLRNIHRQRVDTLLETVAAVYLFVKEQQLIELYTEQLSELAGHLKMTAIKEKAGLARAMDIYRLEIRIKEVEDSRNLARERLDNATDQLKTILALPLDQKIEIVAPLLYTFITIDEKKAVVTALEKRIEIKQGASEIAEARRMSQIASLKIQPDLQLEALYSRRGSVSALDRRLVLDEDLFSVGLTSTTDFSRSTEKARWVQSRIALDREQLQFSQLQQNIAQEISRTINSLEKSEERINLRREQITQAMGKQKLAQIKFSHGKADNFDLIESQMELQRAKANLVTDEIQYIINGYRLRGAMGTLLEYNGI